MSRASPGPLTLVNRPKVNTTPRSCFFSTLIEKKRLKPARIRSSINSFNIELIPLDHRTEFGPEGVKHW